MRMIEGSRKNRGYKESAKTQRKANRIDHGMSAIGCTTTQRLGWHTVRSGVRLAREIGARQQSSGSRDSAAGARASFSPEQYVVAAAGSSLPAKPCNAAGLQRLLKVSKHSRHLLLVPAPAGVPFGALSASREVNADFSRMSPARGLVDKLLALPEETPMVLKPTSGAPRMMKRGPRGLQKVKIGSVAVLHCLD